jgi:hypothetical protein
MSYLHLVSSIKTCYQYEKAHVDDVRHLRGGVDQWMRGLDVYQKLSVLWLARDWMNNGGAVHAVLVSALADHQIDERRCTPYVRTTTRAPYGLLMWTCQWGLP